MAHFIIKQHTDAYLTNDKITHYKWLPLIAHEDKPINNQLFTIEDDSRINY